jgi:hypothetical protein
MYDKTKFDKMEALKCLVSKLTFRMIEVQSTLSELNRAVGDPRPFDRNLKVETCKSVCKEQESPQSTGNTVVFEKFPDGTAEGITLPIEIGKYENGESIYF